MKDIKVGTSIALMVAEGEDWKTVEMPSGVGASSQAASEPSSGGNGTYKNYSIQFFPTLAQYERVF